MTDRSRNLSEPFIINIIFHIGSLRLASGPDYLKLLQQQVNRAKALGLNEGIIGPAEALKIFLFWDVLLIDGRELGLQPIGYKALESLRLEKGYRDRSADITSTENPYEAGLGFCVRLTK